MHGPFFTTEGDALKETALALMDERDQQQKELDTFRQQRRKIISAMVSVDQIEQEFRRVVAERDALRQVLRHLLEAIPPNTIMPAIVLIEASQILRPREEVVR
jgi:hypothetical protein